MQDPIKITLRYNTYRSPQHKGKYHKQQTSRTVFVIMEQQYFIQFLLQYCFWDE